MTLSFHRLTQPIRVEGVGLHTGRESIVHLLPKPVGTGIVINGVPLQPDLVADNKRATTLSTPTGMVSTVEHLLAAITGCRISAIEIQVDGGEVPILDGSCAEWYDRLMPHVVPTNEPDIVTASETIIVEDGDRWLRFDPAPDLSIEVTTEFPSIPKACVVGNLSNFRSFMRARTFGFLEEHECLKAQGLARGAHFDNVLVVDQHGEAINAGQIPAAEEVARHKWLDLLGDLATLGQPWTGHIQAVKPGHDLNIRLARALSKSMAKAKSDLI